MTKKTKPITRGNYSVKGLENSAQVAQDMDEKMQQQLAAAPRGIPVDLLPAPGLLPGTFTVLCSLPQLGKTVYLVNLALELAGKGKNVAIFLPESSPADFMAKAVWVSGGPKAYQRAPVQPRQYWTGMKASLAKLASAGLYFCPGGRVDTGMVTDKAARLDAALRQHGRRLDAVLVDSLNYLQDGIYGEGKMRDLLRLSRKLNLSVVATFGLPSSEGGSWHGRRTIADTRQADLSECETDFIWHLERPEYFDRADPTIRGMASLHLLRPAVSVYPHLHHLKFNCEKLKFERPPFCGVDAVPVCEF